MAWLNIKVWWLTHKFPRPYEWIISSWWWSKSITWNRYVDIFATSILGYKIYGNSEQSGTPTPDSSIEVKSVGDKTMNLLNRPNGTYSTDEKGSVTVLNNITTANVQFNTNWTIYKLTGDVNSTNICSSLAEMKTKSTDDVFFKSGHTYIVKLFDSTDNYNDLQIANTTTNMQISNGVAFTPTEDFNTLWVRMNKDGSGSQTGNKTFKIMIVESSTAPTSYIPYGYQVSVNVSGKNLFDKSLYDNRGWYYSGGVIANSTANATVVMRAIPNKTYYIKHCSVAGGGRVMYTAEENWTEGSSCSWLIGNTSTTIEPNEVQSFTVPSDAKWIFLLAGRQATASLQEQLDDYMLSEKELTADTPYEPYYNTTTSIYLNSQLHKVWNYQDVLNSNWTITRNVGVKVLDWTESFTKQEYSTDNIGFRLRITDRVQLKDEVICSHYPYSNLTSSSAPNNSIVTFTSVNLDIKDNRFATAEDFKAFLAQQYAAWTPVIIYYQLATSTTETITAPEITLSWAWNYHIEIDTEVDATFDLTYN